ncbi:MAG: DUF302 domain-containing protein [Proteobacteria bacterium]|nr:MAG: DUF302 domain-containing protein [Pseudomonadota bacterium]
MPRHLAVCLALGLILAPAPPARADDTVVRHLNTRDYATARIALTDAIIDEGLRVSSVSDFGQMLARTDADVHHGAAVYRHAEVFAFCSVLVASQLVREAPENIARCPLTVAIYQLAGPGEPRIHLVYRPPGGASPGGRAGQALLERIGQRTADNFPPGR